MGVSEPGNIPNGRQCLPYVLTCRTFRTLHPFAPCQVAFRELYDLSLISRQWRTRAQELAAKAISVSEQVAVTGIQREKEERDDEVLMAQGTLSSIIQQKMMDFLKTMLGITSVTCLGRSMVAQRAANQLQSIVEATTTITDALAGAVLRGSVAVAGVWLAAQILGAGIVGGYRKDSPQNVGHIFVRNSFSPCPTIGYSCFK